MMPPHPDTVFNLQTLRYQDLLTEAARERRAGEAAMERPRPARMERVQALAGRMVAQIAATASPARSSRRLARAWS